MFIGHFGAGFAAKKIDNRPSLGTMFIAAQFVDLLWPIFVIFGIEKKWAEAKSKEAIRDIILLGERKRVNSR